MPAWDAYAGALLDRALESVLSQSQAAEVIVVDNASETPVVTADRRVRVVRTPARLTCGAARNFGLRWVHAPLVVMWDADDVMLPGTLRFLCDGIAADRRLVAHAAAIVESPSGLRHRWPRRWVVALRRWPRLFATINAVWSQYPTTGATIMRTEVVRESGGFRAADGTDDWTLGVALLWRGRVGWSERPGRAKALHPTSLMSTHSTIRDLLAATRAVRRAIRADREVPAWFRVALPLVRVLQYAVILVVRPLIGVSRPAAGSGSEEPVVPAPAELAGVRP